MIIAADEAGFKWFKLSFLLRVLLFNLFIQHLEVKVLVTKFSSKENWLNKLIHPDRTKIKNEWKICISFQQQLLSCS